MFKLLTAFRFLQIQSPDLRWYQWVYPTVLTLAFCVSFYWITGTWVRLSNPKVIGDINGLMSLLIAFYIAALAAIATFHGASLDSAMKGRTPVLIRKFGESRLEEKLTRRRFLAALFGYCAAMAILVYIVGAVAVHIESPCVAAIWVSEVLGVASGAAATFYIWMLASLWTVTMLGLHYFVERMHRD